MPDDGQITSVTDTAFWVATLRADESARTDAAFKDPLSAVLAGERGSRIARGIPGGKLTAWGVTMRTCAIDRLIHEALATGVDTILNLGAGLDTRPYRLPLPASLRWIEADLPQLIEFKDAALSGYTASCRVERIGLDLRQAASRERLFAALAERSGPVAVICEGLIPYFSVNDAFALASDLYSVAAVNSWIQDFDNAGLRSVPRAWRKPLRAAPLLFNAEDWFVFFRKTGWVAASVITSGDEAARLQRSYPTSLSSALLMKLLPRDVRQRILDASGAVLLHRQSNPRAQS